MQPDKLDQVQLNNLWTVLDGRLTDEKVKGLVEFQTLALGKACTTVPPCANATEVKKKLKEELDENTKDYKTFRRSFEPIFRTLLVRRRWIRLIYSID